MVVGLVVLVLGAMALTRTVTGKINRIGRRQQLRK
jgi:hypothetical protein